MYPPSTSALNLSAEPARNSPTEVLSNAKILIVEDDESIRSALKAFFSLVSLDAHWAEDGTQALSIVERMHAAPTLILVDGRLPDMHGLELIQILRKKLPKSTSIYLFSADTEYATQLERFGVDGFIPKPFDADSLLSFASRYA
ncbi:MAG: response regulator [Methylotenera sp.]|nr:response regulator [Oligoflexia bacterium]